MPRPANEVMGEVLAQLKASAATSPRSRTPQDWGLLDLVRDGILSARGQAGVPSCWRRGIAGADRRAEGLVKVDDDVQLAPGSTK